MISLEYRQGTSPCDIKFLVFVVQLLVVAKLAFLFAVLVPRIIVGNFSRKKVEIKLITQLLPCIFALFSTVSYSYVGSFLRYNGISFVSKADTEVVYQL